MTSEQKMKAEITYKVSKKLDLDETIQLYRDSTLGQRRPVDDRNCMAQMIKDADLIITAWHGDLLVGISRTLTDFCYVAYLADLAVHQSYQKKGIGVELMQQTRAQLGPNCMIVLLAAPAATAYYPRVGFSNHPQAWILHSGDKLG